MFLMKLFLFLCFGRRNRKHNKMACCLPKGLGWLPIIYSVGTLLSFIITYIIAVWNGDISAVSSSISDTGSYHIQRNIFSLMLSLSCAFGLVNCFVRYLQVSKTEREHKDYSQVNGDNNDGGEKSSCANVVFCNNSTLIIGVIIMLCGFTIAAFQVMYENKSETKLDSQ